MRTTIAAITIVRGRHQHLIGQMEGLRAQTRPPDVYVVIPIDDPDVVGIVRERADPAWDTRISFVALDGGRLPLSRARNLGAATAVDAGADHLVFLDVDCVPGPDLVARYGNLLALVPPIDEPVVLSGDVAYEQDGEQGDPGSPDTPRPVRHHPARPPTPEREVRRQDDLTLFWSLSFAVTARGFTLVGGFDEAYVGYGAEDTDFGQRLGRAGGSMWMVGGAPARHQYHASESPPVEHAADIVVNATTFHRRWGWWPMQSWLEELCRLGLVERGLDGDWRLSAQPDVRADVGDQPPGHG